MMKRFFVICLLLANSNIFANKFYPNKLNTCHITKQYENDYEPEKFFLNNNLLKASGKIENYIGEKIILSGVLLDEKCAPISNAKIYIWQVNEKGKYPYKQLKPSAKKNVEINTKYSFQGSGVTVTDNKGMFNFITIMPKSIDKYGANINLRVIHENFEMFQTKLLLNKNQFDSDDLNSIKKYRYKIIIPGRGTKIY